VTSFIILSTNPGAGSAWRRDIGVVAVLPQADT
jgi:hypothetical protein